MLRALGTRMANRAGEPPRVVVVGGGITGLVAAYTLHRERPEWDILLLEKSDRVGGNIRTDRNQGFLIDAGPDSFIRTKPDAFELCKELGIDGELIGTEEAARHVYIAHDGRLELLPGGMSLAIPTRVEPLFRTPLLSRAGKLRILAEPVVRAGKPSDDESILEFFSRRIGPEGAERLAAPLLSGIYAGDASELSVRATFPQLVELEEKYGSLLRGLLVQELGRQARHVKSVRLLDIYRWLRRTGEARAASPFLSFENGMQTLVDALQRAIPETSVRLRAGVKTVRALEAGGFVVEVDRESISADAVVVAAPAHAAASLLEGSQIAAELARIRYESTATVFFALERSRVAHPLHGFGFIVPPGEGGILAGTWVSSKWRNRAPEGGVLVRAFVGGARDPRSALDFTDGEIVAFARSELERLMGPLGKMHFARVYRYRNSSPQPVVGHPALLSRIRTLASQTCGLHLIGAAYDGVGIPDCVRQARGAARTVVQELSQSAELRAAAG
jgi:oxygen-dependent protoporphyrinogen oxidase